MERHPAYDQILETVHAVEAPHALRERIADERDRTVVRRMVVKRMKLTGAMAAVAAALGITVGLVASGGSADAPSPLAAAALATRGVAAPAPAVAAGGQTLRAAVDDVAFPVWHGWRPSGQRSDSLSGRATRTLYYDGPSGARVGYTIVAGDALSWPRDARRVMRRGVEVRVTRSEGRVMAFWREHGHTCVVSAPDSVPEDRMVMLATYDA